MEVEIIFGLLFIMEMFDFNKNAICSLAAVSVCAAEQEKTTR